MNRKKPTKLFAVLLALVMMFSLLPATVDAAESAEPAGHRYVDTDENGKCDVCESFYGEAEITYNHAPVLKSGVQDVIDQCVIGQAYLLRDLQSGKIFEDPEGDALFVTGGGVNGSTSTSYYYQRSTDGGQTWSEELNFVGALFGATTISLSEKTPGTYNYRFYAKDSKGASSASDNSFWNLTLTFDTAENLTWNTTFYVSRDQNYSSNGNIYPVIKLYPSLGTDENGYAIPDYAHEVAFTDSTFGDDSTEGTPSGTVNTENNYNMFYATVRGGWYVYEGYGYNSNTKEYDIPLGSMQIKLPLDSNVDGNKGGGTEAYLRLSTIHTTSKKTDGTYFGADDYTASFVCPIMECTAKPGTAYKDGNYIKYPFLLYAGGNSCLYNRYVYPTDTSTYIFNSAINATIAVGYTVNATTQLSINPARLATITVPKDADFALYFQYNNFNTGKIDPVVDWSVNEDGLTKTAKFQISSGSSNYSWRMTADNYVTKAGWLTSISGDTSLSFGFDADSATNKTSHDFSQIGTTTINRDEADLQVFASPSGSLEASASTRIRAYRMWELINSDTANIMIEPDFHWNVLTGDASVQTVDGGNATAHWADVKAGNQDSIVSVTYDSIDVYTDNNASTHGSHGGFYPATNPDRAAYFVVSDSLGNASAEIAFNGNYTSNARGDNWDYIYDTWYYMDSDEQPVLDFTTSGASAVEVAYGLTDSSLNSSVSGFTTLQQNEDGKWEVDLSVFNNAAYNYGGTVIIRMTDGSGAYSYQLVHVAKMSATFENESFPGEPIMPGNQVKVTFSGLYRSINKIAGIFNPTTFYEKYTDTEERQGTLGQYQRMSNASIVMTVPKEDAVDKAGNKLLVFDPETKTAQYKFTNGYVYGSMYSAANPFTAMYMMTDTGVGTNFNAVMVAFAFQKLADIPVEVHEAATCSVTLDVTNAENYTAVVTDSEGETVAAQADGTYDLGYGTYQYSIESTGFIKEMGSFKIGSADGEAKTVAVTLREVTAATWDGTSTAAPAQNEAGVYEIGTGAELAWFAAQVNSGTGASYNAILTNDISLGCYLWTPIGNSTTSYKGKFDGNGHYVTDLYCNGSQYQGLFGYGGAGCGISNLGVTGNVYSEKTGAAGILAYSSGAVTIDDCVNYANVTVSGPAATANALAAGIGEGAATAVFTNCINYGTITSSGKYAYGVATGTSANVCPKVFNCYNAGRIASAGAATTYGPVGGSSTSKNSYYLAGTSQGTANSSKSIAVSDEELKALAPTLGEGYKASCCGYPVLLWMDEGHVDANHDGKCDNCEKPYGEPEEGKEPNISIGEDANENPFAELTAPETGWVLDGETENAFVVESNAEVTVAGRTEKVPCVVAVYDPETETYTEVLAEQNAAGKYVFSTPLTEAQTVVVALKGDCDGDGKLDEKDSVRLLRYLNSFTTNNEISAMGRIASDINGDTLVNEKDAVRILRFLNGGFETNNTLTWSTK